MIMNLLILSMSQINLYQQFWMRTILLKLRFISLFILFNQIIILKFFLCIIYPIKKTMENILRLEMLGISDQIKGLKEEIEKKQAEEKEKAQELEKLKKQIKDIEQELQAKRQELKASEQEAQSLNAKILELQQAKEKKEQEILNAEDQIALCDNAICHLNNLITNIEAELENLDTKRKQIEQNQSDAIKQKNQKMADKSSQESLLDSIKREILELVSKIQGLEGKRGKKIQQKLAQLRNQLKGKRSIKADLLSKIVKLSILIVGLTETISSCKLKNLAVDTEIRSGKAIKSSKEVELVNNTRGKVSAESKKNGLQKAVERLDGLQNKTQEKVCEVGRETKQAKTQIDTFNKNSGFVKSQEAEVQKVKDNLAKQKKEFNLIMQHKQKTVQNANRQSNR